MIRDTVAMATARQHPYVPSVRARRLAKTLRELREAAALSQTMVAARLDWSPAKIGHIETCTRRAFVRDVEKLLSLYGVIGPQHDAIIAVARDAEHRNWWTEYADVLGGPYIALEDAASEICIWDTQVIPGLLQTPEYARSIISMGGANPDEVERRVDARLIRQKLLGRPDAPRLLVVLPEAVLEHRIGSPGEWREQMHRLEQAAARPNVTIQVLPKTVGAHPGMEGSLIVLQFDDEVDPPVAYCEGPFGAIFMESPQKVARCNLAFGRLSDAALDPIKSAEMIAAAALR